MIACGSYGHTNQLSKFMYKIIFKLRDTSDSLDFFLLLNRLCHNFLN